MGADDFASLASLGCAETVEKWKAIGFNTYRAICRRGGVFGNHVSLRVLCPLVAMMLIVIELESRVVSCSSRQL